MYAENESKAVTDDGCTNGCIHILVLLIQKHFILAVPKLLSVHMLS
jgi:hypothetical protein